MLAVVDTGQLVEVVVASLVAGLAVTTIYALIVLGTSRWGAARRSGRGGTALAYGALVAGCGVAFAAIIAFAVEIMLSKS